MPIREVMSPTMSPISNNFHSFAALAPLHTQLLTYKQTNKNRPIQGSPRRRYTQGTEPTPRGARQRIHEEGLDEMGRNRHHFQFLNPTSPSPLQSAPYLTTSQSQQMIFQNSSSLAANRRVLLSPQGTTTPNNIPVSPRSAYSEFNDAIHPTNRPRNKNKHKRKKKEK